MYEIPNPDDYIFGWMTSWHDPFLFFKLNYILMFKTKYLETVLEMQNDQIISSCILAPTINQLMFSQENVIDLVVTLLTNKRKFPVT